MDPVGTIGNFIPHLVNGLFPIQRIATGGRPGPHPAAIAGSLGKFQMPFDCSQTHVVLLA